MAQKQSYVMKRAPKFTEHSMNTMVVTEFESGYKAQSNYKNKSSNEIRNA